MRKVILILILIVTQCFFGCVREDAIGYDIPFEGEKLGVFGFLSNETYPQLKLILTQPVSTDSLVFSVSGANAYLLRDSQLIDTFFFHDNLGLAKTKTLLNEKYAIKVDFNGKTFESEKIELPVLVKMENLTYELSSDSKNIVITFSFRDDASQKDYYNYAITQKHDDRILEYPSSYNRVSNDVIITDDEFNGKKQTLVIDKNIKKIVENGTSIWSNTIIVKLFHLSESVYLFNKSIEDNGDFGNQFSNQLPPWGNINGGAYGYLGAVTVDSVVIHL